MPGHGGPNVNTWPRNRGRAGGALCRGLLRASILLTAFLNAVASGAADDFPGDVRVRLLWGSGPNVQEKWSGVISLTAGKIVDLQPLGVEADEAAALRIEDNQIVVTPLVRRTFDGCDVTLRGAVGAALRANLQSDAGARQRVVEVPVAQLGTTEIRKPLDELGGYLSAARAPGDVLRVRFDRDHLVFDPNETLTLALEPALVGDLGAELLSIHAQLTPLGSGTVLWQQTQPYDPRAPKPLDWTVAAPASEGAYRVTFTVKRPVGFAERLVPWDSKGPLATRAVDLVVIDPVKRLPRLSGAWTLVEEIDPATSDWRQRLPQWAHLDILPALRTPRPLGNVQPAVHALGDGSAAVTLPATPQGEPAWQAYVLPVRDVGEPHAIEIDLPRGVQQHLSLSILEPDAAGRAVAFGRDAGAYSSASSGGTSGAADGPTPFRMTFWPRTKSPVLLIANRAGERPAQYGKIRILRGATVAPATPVAADATSTGRVVAMYVASPRWVESLGAAGQRDAATGVSVPTWASYLAAINRFAQQLDAQGYNAAVVAVAADGASLAPVAGLGSSPRFDGSLLAGGGADPVRKDVLEAMLRVFDREGIAVIPAIQLAAPLPALEPLRLKEKQGVTGVSWIGADGRRWTDAYTAESGHAPFYNPLSAAVQKRTAKLVDDFAARYATHKSFGGLALQLAGSGYGLLPGSSWGMDDATVGRFVAETKIALPKFPPDEERFTRRAEILRGPELARWNAWRAGDLAKFYGRLATRVQRISDKSPAEPTVERRLLLCTEDLFAGPEVEATLRRAIASGASLAEPLAEAGVDLAALAAQPGVVVLRPRRLGPEEPLTDHALDLRLNAAMEFSEVLGGRSAALDYRVATTLRLPSFDVQSPFGEGAAYLSLRHASTPCGDEAARDLAAVLAEQDADLVVDGADSPSLVDDAAGRQFRRLLALLPPSASEVRHDQRQPISLRVYRQGEQTVVCLLNQCSWATSAELGIDADASSPWQLLGEAAAGEDKPTDAASAKGVAPAGSSSWKIDLPPYGLVARCYENRDLRVGELSVHVDPKAREAIAARVAAVDDRLQSLDIERPYPYLQNPQFELVGADGRMLAWQPRVGEAGRVEIDGDQAALGSRSLRLHSEDGLGVAAQSLLFPIPPTGQLTIRAKVRGTKVAKDAQLLAWVEHRVGSVRQPRYAVLGVGPTITREWTACELTVDDLPLGSDGQMNIQFHLAGKGDVWVDDIQLFDLRFAKGQRQELAKRLLAAQQALDDGQVVDCLRQLDGYSLRYLEEFVPARTDAVTNIAAKPAEPATPTANNPPQENPRFKDRLRGFVPKVWR